MSKLLMPAAEVLAMDATDFSCGDALLKEIDKNVRTAVAGWQHREWSWRHSQLTVYIPEAVKAATWRASSKTLHLENI